MSKISRLAQSGLLTSLIALATLFFPSLALATGVNRPVGADAGTYSYNQTNGCWENEHYSYDPKTGTTTPKDPVIYKYNNYSHKWDTTTWVYNAPSGKYVPETTSVITPPAGAVTVGGPIRTTDSTDPEQNGNNKNATGSDSNNTTIGLSNTLGSQSATGDATISANTNAGNATSGNALAVQNLINMLNSSSNNISTGKVATFTSDINGNVTGDILLDPAKLSTLQPAGTTTNLQINSNNDLNAQINNQLTVGANSGNATVSQNTTAGNAASGNADAVANVINVINSAINSGQSFVGVMNINGNLNGDILLPPNFINQLLAANTPHATIDTSNIANNKVDFTNNTNQSIDNQVELSAASGGASVTDNTKAGNAATGNASTNLTIFNLTGSNVVGTNDLLVFVNVLGKWVGMIVNAPAGTTAASLGGGITKNTLNANVNANNQTTEGINNDIRLAAQSGNADVSENTIAGNAASGDATASANLLNMINNNLSLSNWFGVLFINVFGTWNGSFGVNTAAGNPLASNPVVASAAAQSTAHNTKVFRFIPTGSDDKFTLAAVDLGAADSQIHGTTTHKTPRHFSPSSSSDQKSSNNWVAPAFGTIIGISMLGSERMFTRRKKS